MPGTSIALATFNGEAYLAAQLESLAAQTSLPAELIISDDCSEDRTLDITHDFASRAPFPVRILRNEVRLGFRDNFLHAVEHCQADLVAFCDQDDVWEPDKLAAMEPLFENPEVLLAYHNATLIDADDRATGRLYRGGEGIATFPPLTRHPWLVIPGFTQMFRRDLTRFSHLHSDSREADWPGESLAHDRWFYLLASVLGTIIFVGRPLVRYRQHTANAYGLYTDRRAQRDRLVRGEQFIRAAAAAAANRSDLLHRMQSLLSDAERERSLRGIAYYDALSERLDHRTDVYASRSIGARIKALSALFMRGAYGQSYGSARFELSDLLMDAYLAVPLGPRLRRLLPWCIARYESITGTSADQARAQSNVVARAGRPAPSRK